LRQGGSVNIAEHARRLELRDGDVVCIPADTDADTAQHFAEALIDYRGDLRLMVVLGDVHSLDEAAMNAAGWYRK
jgi:hypothetical protein